MAERFDFREPYLQQDPCPRRRGRHLHPELVTLRALVLFTISTGSCQPAAEEIFPESITTSSRSVDVHVLGREDFMNLLA